ncbi:phage tail tape measure protein, partial [Roseburia sp. 1XD42-69]|uniref:phage tail tape measure protein n=1 Tax=Roseburia sp. 1XD42-69 TaxID=2320088 RepID=UPI001FAAA364
MNNEFILDIIARLNKQLSKSAINGDLKSLNNTMYVRVLAKLSKTLASKELKKQLKELDNLNINVGLNAKIDKDAETKIKQTIQNLQNSISDLEIGLKTSKVDTGIDKISKSVQRKISKTPLNFNLEIKKEKAIADIEYIAKKYSKLFSNLSASQKYEKILNSAYGISDTKDLSNVRAQISTFTSELKSNGLATQSVGDKWKTLIDRSKELFSAASVIRILFTQMKEAVHTTIDLDKVYTDLVKVNDQLERNDYSNYLEKCNRKAQDLAATQKALIEGAAEFSKSGYDLSTSDKLTEKSTILSNVGEMEASDSVKAIISGVQAYDTIDGYTDVADKAQALIDKYNELGNTASITTSELAQGVQSVGSVFADANTSVDEFLALLSAGNRQYQDADALALGLRTSALRIRGCTAELEAMGEETDTVVTSASKLEEKIKGLTNVNGSGGVEILEADKETFRSIYDIYVDIGKVYKDMSDVDQSALLELIAGKHRASAISATLNNMTEAETILQNSLHAAGSAQREYDAYLESTEAHIQQFQAKLVETYSTFMNGDMISHVADLGTGILDLVNKADLLKHSLIAIATIKIGQGITTVGGAIAGTITQMNTLGNAIQKVRNLPLDDVLREKTLKEVGEATKDLTEKNLKLLLSQKQLEDGDRKAILEKHNLTKEQAKEKLETMGLTTATNANTTANTANAASANTLKGTLAGLTTSIKATWAAMSMLQKASIIFAAASTLWSIGSSFMDKQKQQAEEAAQALEELSSKAEEAKSNISNIESSITSKKDSLDDIAEEYAKLAQGVDLLTNANKNLSTENHERFLELSNQLSELFPSLTRNYDENGNAILNLSGDVNTITSSLYQLLDVQKKIAEQEILDNMSDVWAGYQNDRKNEFFEKEHASSGLNFYTEALKNMLNGEEISTEYNQTMASTFDKLLDTAGLQAEDFIRKTKKFDLGRGWFDAIYTVTSYDFSGLTETQKQQIETAYRELTNSYEGASQNAAEKIESMNAEMRSYLYTWLTNEFTYQKINSADPSLGMSIQQILYDSLEHMPTNVQSWDEATAWFEENILFAINNINDSEIANALSDIYSGGLNSGKLLNAISKVQDYFGKEHPISVSLQTKVDDIEPLISNVKDKLKGTEFDDRVGELSLGDLQIAADFNIPVDSIESWDELITKIEEYKESINDINKNKPFSQRFKDLWDSESFKDAREELQKLSKEAGITEDDIYSLARENEELALLLDESGISAQFAAACFNQVCNGADGFS